MKTIMSLMVMALMAAVLSGQTIAASPVVKGQDTLQQAKNLQNQQSPQFGWHERGFPGFGKGREPMCANAGMRQNFGNPMPSSCCVFPMHPMRMHGFAGKHLFHLLFLGALLMGVIHILLTITVSLDMARIGRFNGLWVAVTLLAGIPGTAVYALSRIGDAIDRARQKN